MNNEEKAGKALWHLHEESWQAVQEVAYTPWENVSAQAKKAWIEMAKKVEIK